MNCPDFLKAGDPLDHLRLSIRARIRARLIVSARVQRAGSCKNTTLSPAVGPYPHMQVREIGPSDYPFSASAADPDRSGAVVRRETQQADRSMERDHA